MLDSDSLNFWSCFGCSKTAILALARSKPARTCSRTSLFLFGSAASEGIDFLTVLMRCFKSGSRTPSKCSNFLSNFWRLSLEADEFSSSWNTLTYKSLNFPAKMSNSSLETKLLIGVEIALWSNWFASPCSDSSKSGTKVVLN